MSISPVSKKEKNKVTKVKRISFVFYRPPSPPKVRKKAKYNKMVCCQIMFRWIRSEFNEHRERKEKRRKCLFKQMESQSRDEDTDVKITMKHFYRSFSNRLLSLWACFELFLLVLFLYKKKKVDFPNNFLNPLCEGGSVVCSNVLNKMIATKVIAAMLLFLGAKSVRVPHSPFQKC